MASRLLSDLDPRVRASAAAVLRQWSLAGHDVLVTCTYRSNAEQRELYAQGRTRPGHIVTHAPAGQSYHNFGLALDFVPLVNGKADWQDVEVFGRLGEIAKATDAAVVWGGDWPEGKQDRPHIEWHGFGGPNG